MGRIISTLKYGSLKTKLILMAILLVILAGAAGFALGIIRFSLLWLGAGAILLVLGLAALFTAFVNVEIDPDEAETDTPGTNPSDAGEAMGRTRRGRRAELSDDTGRPIKSERSGRNEAVDRDGQGSILSDIMDMELTGKHLSFNDAETAAEAVEHYTKRTYRTILRRYKVRRNYIPIMIDSCPAFETEKTPALCWSKKDKVSFLLLEGNERVVTMPMNRFLEVGYRKNSVIKNAEAYDSIRQMQIFDTFADVMPNLDSSTNRMGATTYTANLYVLGRDLTITPRSLRALKEKYQFSVDIFKDLDVKGEYSMYFKKAYEMRILWTDTVIGQQEYQNRIRTVLESMVEDRELIKYDFEDNLRMMVQYRLITTEYADYYRTQRQKRDMPAKGRK